MSKVLAISKKFYPYIPEICKDMEKPPMFSVRSIGKREHLSILAGQHSIVPKSMIKSAQEVADTSGDAQEAAEKVAAQLDVIDMAELWKVSLNNRELLENIVSKCCDGWTDLPDENGDPVPFAKENVELLSDELLTDLVQRITGQIGAKDAKNSEPSSSSESGSTTTTGEGESSTADSAEKTNSSLSETAAIPPTTEG